MDVLLQRHCARYIYPVPDGLRELLSDITREVLRNQPEDIPTYVADYLDALLITRENARISARFVQQLTEASEIIVDLMGRTGMTREEVDKTATIIQDAFKSWSERKGILKEDEDVIVARIVEEINVPESKLQIAAVVIQHAFRAFKIRQQRESDLLKGIIDWRVAARSAIKLYRKTGVSPEEAKRAANLIKAAYKGYYTRKAIRDLNQRRLSEVQMDEGAEDYYSMISEPPKTKGVRIDYATVVPHVDFGDEELIAKEIASAEDIDFTEEQTLEKRISDRIFVQNILKTIVDSVAGLDSEEKIDLPFVEEKDSQADIFIHHHEGGEDGTSYNKVIPLTLVPDEELIKQREEARKEMVELKKLSLQSEELKAQIEEGGTEKTEGEGEQKIEGEREQTVEGEGEQKVEGEKQKVEGEELKVESREKVEGEEGQKMEDEVKQEVGGEEEKIEGEGEKTVEVVPEEAQVTQEAAEEKPEASETTQAEVPVEEETQPTQPEKAEEIDQKPEEIQIEQTPETQEAEPAQETMAETVEGKPEASEIQEDIKEMQPPEETVPAEGEITETPNNPNE